MNDVIDFNYRHIKIKRQNHDAHKKACNSGFERAVINLYAQIYFSKDLLSEKWSEVDKNPDFQKIWFAIAHTNYLLSTKWLLSSCDTVQISRGLIGDSQLGTEPNYQPFNIKSQYLDEKACNSGCDSAITKYPTDLHVQKKLFRKMFTIQVYGFQRSSSFRPSFMTDYPQHFHLAKIKYTFYISYIYISIQFRHFKLTYLPVLGDHANQTRPRVAASGTASRYRG